MMPSQKCAVPKLKGLYLGKTQIGDAGAAGLASALEHGAALPLLAQLHLFGNKLSGGGVAIVQAASRAAERTRKLTIDFE